MKDFNDMTGQELVDAYNEMVQQIGDSPNLRPVKRFESLVAGIHRCQELSRQIKAHEASDLPDCLKRYPTNAPIVTTPAAQEIDEQKAVGVDSVSVEADRRWRNWQPSPGAMVRPRKATFEKQVREERKNQFADAVSAAKPRLGNASKTRRMDRVIRITCAANPRRPGTDSHRYFEAMKGGPTVGQYLAQFPEAERRKAAQWLYNTCTDGFARLLG